MGCIVALALLSLVAAASGAVTAATNYNPVTISVTSPPYDILATPITPDAPYSQAAFQCNITGDDRYPVGGTFPLNISVTVGQRVRIIFANGNLNGATVTQQGEPGVIVQQGGSPIVQQSGGASPIVQKVGSPIVQQNVASPAVVVVQQTPTVVQASVTVQAASTVSIPPLVVYQPAPVSTPAATPAPVLPPPATPTSPPPTVASPPPASKSSPPPVVASPPPSNSSPPPATTVPSPPPPPTTPDSSPNTTASATATAAAAATAAATAADTAAATASAAAAATATALATVGRKLLQDTVPGGPNNGLVEYVALASANTLSGFYAGSTQFGVPYVEFTASEAVRGQVASFRGVLEVAQVVGGVPLFPFRPNPSLSPECQVNVNFKVA